MEGCGDDGHPVDGFDFGELLEMLFRAPDVSLEAGVAALDDVTGPALAPALTLEVPVHHVPSTGSETQLDRRRVDDDPISDADGPGELHEHVRPFRACTQIDLDPLQP